MFFWIPLTFLALCLFWIRLWNNQSSKSEMISNPKEKSKNIFTSWLFCILQDHPRRHKLGRYRVAAHIISSLAAWGAIVYSQWMYWRNPIQHLNRFWREHYSTACCSEIITPISSMLPRLRLLLIHCQGSCWVSYHPAIHGN